VISLTCTAMLHAALLSTGGATYTEAHQLNLQTGRPLVVLVGADWCPHCRVMKQSTLPQVAQRGLLGKVAFAEVNSDREGALANQLMSGGPIPQLIMYRKTNDGWQRTSLVGSRSAGEIESFLQQGLATPSLATPAPPQLGAR
jgi:thioredoxin-like negative regulator of GroEL